MASNKFATMLHRNTNKITLILVYAVLEWILIILLLLNSLFSYLITKFVDYFGLKRPCIWCTRIDHIIEPENGKCSCRDLVCEAHAFEISKLGFCLNHRKLAESETMCEDCSSSCHPNFVNLSVSFGVFPSMQQKGMIHDDDDDSNKVIGDGVKLEPFKCSCCGVNLFSKFYLIRDKPSLRVLDYTQKQNLLTESAVEAQIDEDHRHSDHGREDFVVLDHLEEEQNTAEKRVSHMVFDVDEGSSKGENEANGISVCALFHSGKETMYGKNCKLNLGIAKGKEEPIREETLNVHHHDQPCEETTNQVSCSNENNEQIVPKHLEFVIYGNDCLLSPVDIGESFATESKNQHRYKVGNDGLSGDEDLILDFDINSAAESEPLIEKWHTSGDTVSAGLECTNALEANGVASIPLRIRRNSLELMVREESSDQNNQEKFALTTKDSSINGNVEANMQIIDGESCSVIPEVSEGATQMQGDELEADVPTQNQDILLDSIQQIQEVPSSSTTTFIVQDDSENLHQLHKKLLMLGRKKSGAEESLEGSVTSDIECGELTIEKLKLALKAERKALNTLYEELEEERSASAVAANQTMAMINRLQEEKAAMRMEALQYERMVEEQSEYDQEALRTLNELVIKREKEKLELKKQLEIYRTKVHEYEVREKMVMSRRGSIRGRTAPSCTNARDRDGLSFHLNQDTKEENGIYSHQEFRNQGTNEDAVIYLEESLANFEEERLFILEQLKMLVEKLVILNYEEEYFDGIKSVEHLVEENGNRYQEHIDYIDQVNGLANVKHHDGRQTVCTKGKRVLPLFNATGTEAENGVMSNGLDLTSMQNSSNEKIQLEKKKLDVEVEVDHVHERLQALEADREFLKHCISSLGNGDKGLDLIREILQHLRDLRNVEQRIMNMGHIAL